VCGGCWRDQRQSGFSPETPVISGELRGIGGAPSSGRSSPFCRDIQRTHRVPRAACHARRWRVRIPSAASKRPVFAGLFRVISRVVRLRRVGLTPDSPRADRRRIQGKRRVRRPIVARPNRSPSAGPQKVKRSACCGRQQALPANGTFLRRDACRRDTSDPAPRGRVRSQSGNRGRPLRPGEPKLPGRKVSRRTALARVPLETRSMDATSVARGGAASNEFPTPHEVRLSSCLRRLKGRRRPRQRSSLRRRPTPCCRPGRCEYVPRGPSPSLGGRLKAPRASPARAATVPPSR
jgi:hypothetical protein